ncbi:hypothetical protein C5706_33100, partial [Klebsiella pneumoniae]
MGFVILTAGARVFIAYTLTGLLLQKKGISDVISGTLKTIMGFVILTAGARVFIAYTLT